MCTLIILRRPDHRWPLVLGANRDEMRQRPWKAPARHWPDRPEAIAGLDELAGGSWLGLNDQGVVATILNRYGTLGPAPDKRSRGELVLEALDHSEAEDAVQAMAELNPDAYRPFNMLIADNSNCYWLTNREGASRVEMAEVPEGVSMLTAHDLNDVSGSDRTKLYLPRFRAVPAPVPDRDEWDGWTMLMGTRDHADEAGPSGAMTMELESGFGTSSSAQIALAAPGEGANIFRFAPGAPDKATFSNLNLKA